MRWLMIVALLTVSSTTAAYSGTFENDFSNEHLDGWNIHIDPKPAFRPVPHLLNFEDGYLVLNKNRVAQEHSASLELGTRNAEEWDSYTFTFRIRFKGVPEPGAAFYTEVRRSDVVANEIPNPANSHNAQSMWILLDERQAIHVLTFRLGQPPLGWAPDEIIHRAKFGFERLERPIASRWIPIKIVAKENHFKFYFDNQLVAKYEDEKAGPGTVLFHTNMKIVVHLDDIKIWGLRIPNIGGPYGVPSEARLATTWGEMKDLPRR